MKPSTRSRRSSPANLPEPSATGADGVLVQVAAEDPEIRRLLIGVLEARIARMDRELREVVAGPEDGAEGDPEPGR